MSFFATRIGRSLSTGRAVLRAAGCASTVAAAASWWAQDQALCLADNKSMTLQGKVALVTGGTGSIGFAIAQQLADAGCHVALVDLNEQRCQEMAARLPTRCIGIAIDVASEPAVTAGVARVTDELGGVDILVNVAGVLSNNKAFETSADEWRNVHAVNYDSCFFLSKACMPNMVKQGWGRVINLSSWAWKSGGLTAGTAYSASKAAMVGLTFSLARQFAADGVTVNAVAPCYVFSPMIMEQLTAEKRAELLTTSKYRESRPVLSSATVVCALALCVLLSHATSLSFLYASVPVRRFCKPEEVAHAVLFLASPLSGFITGEVVDMNGGFQMD